MPVSFPIDFDAIRIAIIQEIQRVTTKTCILTNPKGVKTPRPALPYFSMNVTTPAAKFGDDSTQDVDGNGTINRGGQRRMSVSFQSYAQDVEEAYNYMSLWQAALDQFTTQSNLREAGIAVWTIGNVADISALLNTGYEARAQLDVQFGIASNLEEDVGTIESVFASGTIHSGTEDIHAEQTVPE